MSSSADPYAAWLTIDYPDRDLDRVSTALRLVYAIPVLVVLGLVAGGFDGDTAGETGARMGAFGGVVLVLPVLLMIVFRRRGRLVLGAVHGTLSAGHLRLRRRRSAVGAARRGVCVPPGDRPLSAVLAGMTPVRTTCPYCGEITHLASAEIFLALHDGDATTGDYAYTCPQCTRTGWYPATRTAVVELLSAGVVPIGRN